MNKHRETNLPETLEYISNAVQKAAMAPDSLGVTLPPTALTVCPTRPGMGAALTPAVSTHPGFTAQLRYQQSQE